MQAIFPTETPESSLERDAKLFIQEEVDQNETFELPTHEWPIRQHIELKPRSSSLTFHDKSIEKEKFCAMDLPQTLELKTENSTNEHETFEFSQDSCPHKESPESSSPSATYLTRTTTTSWSFLVKCIEGWL